MTDAAERWQDALLAIRLFAIDPHAVGGIMVRARVGPVLQSWLSYLNDTMGDRPVRRLPAHASEDRLLGGLDLAATLRRGAPVASRGLLAEADGGVIVVPMAERLSPSNAAHLASALDRGQISVERDGLTGVFDTRFGVVLLDEGVDDERVSAALADRIGLWVDLDSFARLDALYDDFAGAEDAIDPADVEVDDDVPQALAAGAIRLGILSLRAVVLAVKVARAAAAMNGRRAVQEPDVIVAARLVLGPRAVHLPSTDDASEDSPHDMPPEAAPEPDEQDESQTPEDVEVSGPLEDIVLEAAQATMPAGLLAELAILGRVRGASQTAGNAGTLVNTRQRGRPAGIRRGSLRSGRLNVVETLRAAAPWQPLRRQGRERQRIEVRQDDFRITKYKRRTETLTIFAVDASGSAALQRLAEAKGAVEQVLAECYVRRDHVALIAFRGQQAELILPPTRSLVRAKRCLAGMPGGGTTPLATGIDAARSLAEDAQRRGQTPVLVFMTDGRPNISRDGTADRPQAMKDALESGQLVRSALLTVLFVDTGPRPRTESRALAEAMGGYYLHLPYAQNRAIVNWVEDASAGGS